MHTFKLDTEQVVALHNLLGGAKVEALQEYNLMQFVEELHFIADSQQCERCGARTLTLYNNDYCYACHTEHNYA